MADIRITQPRRIFASTISQFPHISFSELKKMLVGKNPDQMDNTTLYRIVDTFKQQGLIHEISFKWERILFLSENYEPEKHSVEMTICENCGDISVKYDNLPANLSASSTERRTKSCQKCVIS